MASNPGTSQILPASGQPARSYASGRPEQPLRRRLRVDDVLVVERSTVKRAIRGTVVGNFMEWFDFGIYGYLAVTLASVFTAGLSSGAGLLVTLFGFSVSFLVRPLGGFVLGPLGDRIGRQRVLFLTMSMMAAATALIGLLPGSAVIGLWAVVPLYLLKMIQGFSTGGEYAGATTYVSEFSPDSRRGFFSSWLDVGSYVGFAAGASAVAVTTVVAESVWGPHAMVDGGWRIPFLLAIPLGTVAIFFRLRIPETPAFEEEAGVVQHHDDARFERHGILGILRYNGKEILIAITLVAATNTAGYALTSYMPTYLQTEVGVGNLLSAVATVPVLLVMSACLPLVGALSDRIGRCPVYAIAVVSTLVLMLPAFAIMRIGQFWAVMLALTLVAVPVGFYVAIAASSLPALFPTASRFGAMAIAYNVAVSLFGGTTPFFSQSLIELTGNTDMPAFYIMFFSALGGLALLAMPESAKRPLLGSVPAVETPQEAQALVERQEHDPLIDTRTMPLPAVKERPRA
nr:MFS transporter [Leifsonia xyli]